MVKTKQFEITLTGPKSTFSVFSKSKDNKENYDSEGIKTLRKLLSNEKARMLNAIKTIKPNSIYELSKKLERPFKAVFDDVKLLEKFGFIELVEHKYKGRIGHKPQISADIINISIKI
jgi:predicted transcriptional regulator